MNQNAENFESGENTSLFPRDTRGEVANDDVEVHLFPGDTLVVSIKEESSKLAGGGLSVESVAIRLSYDEVMALLKRARREHRPRKSKTPEAKFSRQIGLITRAISTGRWSTGAEIDREEMVAKLIALLDTFDVGQIHHLSPKAKKALLALREEPDCFVQPAYSNYCLRIASLLS